MFQKSEVCQSRYVSDKNWQIVAKFEVDTEQTGELIVKIAVLLPVGELEVNQDPQTDFTKIDRVLKYMKIITRL